MAGAGRFANNSKALDYAIGGWTLFGDFITQGGSPFTVNMLANNSYSLSSNNVWYPNVVGDPKAVPGGQTIDSLVQRQRVCGSHSRHLRELGQKHSSTDRRLTAVNTSLHKVFRFTERMNLDFSANASNLINHPSFALPDKAIGPGHVGRISRHQCRLSRKWNWSRSSGSESG